MYKTYGQIRALTQYWMLMFEDQIGFENQLYVIDKDLFSFFTKHALNQILGKWNMDKIYSNTYGLF